ncbi:hypothetical protein LZ190_23735, partial [Rhodovulum sulfidophilum]|nr:hypothetical protein [Rhodovulum sulfidophilum]
MATRTSQLIVSLLDRVSAPAQQAARSLRGMQDAARGATGGAFERANASLGAAIQRNNAALAEARAGMVDAVGGALALRAALGAPLGAARTFETALEDIGQKAGVPQEKLTALGE